MSTDYSLRVCVCVCVCSIPYIMGNKYPHNDSNTITILIFFLPMRKAAYKSYRMKFSENQKM